MSSGFSIALLILLLVELLETSNDVIYYTATKIELPTYIILRYGGMSSAQITIESLDSVINSAMKENSILCQKISHAAYLLRMP